MNTNNSPDWAWPALIASLQRDISNLRDHVDEVRRDAVAAREQHRREVEALIEQLREVKAHLEPIISERDAAKKARREMLWGWMGKGGWVIILAAAATAWHWVTKHLSEP